MKKLALILPFLISGLAIAAPTAHPHPFPFPFPHPAPHDPTMDGYNVSIVGEAPESVDLSDPSLPPGLTVEDIQKGLDAAVAEIEAAGNHADLCMIYPDATAEAKIRDCLSQKRYDAVVVGAGIRVPAPNLRLFENVMNAVHIYAPKAAIAFNANPKDSAAAAARVLAKYK